MSGLSGCRKNDLSGFCRTAERKEADGGCMWQNREKRIMDMCDRAKRSRWRRRSGRPSE